MRDKRDKRFFLYFIFFALLLGAISPKTLPQAAESAPDPALSLENFAVDETLGKVEERFIRNSDRIIIQVQDVHAHYVAQENIAAILEHLSSVFGIKKMALEGAWTATDLPKSRAIPTSREKQLLARSLMEEDLISGPVYAALLSPSPITLAGIEDAGLYEKNRELFLKHLSRTDGIGSKLKTYGDELQASKKSSWNPELFAFGKASGNFRETADLGKFLPLLLKTADAKGAVSSDLTQVLLLRDIMALEKSFSKARLEQEIKQVIKKYKNRPWTLEELIRGGKIPAEEIGLYPEVKKLTLLYKMRDQLSLRDLMTQIGTLTGRILGTLVKTPEENALWDKVERFYLAKKILLLRATPSDLAEFGNEKAIIDAELRAAGLSEETALSLEFYDLVKKRDDVFYEKLVNDPEFSGPLAIVTGGFHTAGLSDRLRAAGISYITISPDLSGTAMNEKLYNKRMEEGGSHGTASLWGMAKSSGPKTPSAIRPPPSESQTLSELGSVFKDLAEADQQFAKAYEILLQTKDVRKAVASFSGSPVNVSASEKISRLRASGQMRPRRAGKPEILVSDFREAEFMAKPRPEQLAQVRGWMAQIQNGRAMLISSVGILEGLLKEQQTGKYLELIQKSNDILALLKDISGELIPELLRESDRIRYFDAVDFDLLVRKATARFTTYPPAVMKTGYQSERYVVLPELPVSLVLYRVVALSPELYRAARNPAFLELLQSLVMEILSERLTQKAA